MRGASVGGCNDWGFAIELERIAGLFVSQTHKAALWKSLYEILLGDLFDV